MLHVTPRILTKNGLSSEAEQITIRMELAAVYTSNCTDCGRSPASASAFLRRRLIVPRSTMVSAPAAR